MSHYYEEYPFLMRFEEVLELGAEEEQPAKRTICRKKAEEIDPSQPAIMLTTSGTTAKPKAFHPQPREPHFCL